MSDWDGLRGCDICGNDTTGRLCHSCAQQEMIDNAEGWIGGVDAELEPAEAQADALAVALRERDEARTALDNAASHWRAMRAKLHQHMAECNGRIRMMALDYRATKDKAINDELNIETAFRNGLHNSLADLDHYFPEFFYMFFDENGQEIQQQENAS